MRLITWIGTAYALVEAAKEPAACSTGVTVAAIVKPTGITIYAAAATTAAK
jgi:hypothetical protein